MSYTQELKIFKDTDKNIFLLCGENSYLKSCFFDEILEHFAINKTDIDYEQLSESCTSNDIISACNTVSFFGESKVIVSKDFIGFMNEKSNCDNLCDFLPDMPKTNKLIFQISKKADKRKKLYKTLQKTGLIIELNELSQDQLISWIQSIFAKDQITISKPDAIHMIQLCGVDMMSLKNEIEKVICGTHNKSITTDDIQQIVSESLEYNVFKIHEYFIKKDINQGLLLLNEVFQTEKSPFGIMGLLTNKLRVLYKARTLLDNNVKVDQAIKYIGGHPYAAKIALKECTAFTADHIRNSINQVAKLDFELKSGSASMQTSVENLFIKIYNI